MFDHYSSDETVALIVGGLAAFVSWAVWYFRLAFVARKVRPRGPRWPLAIAPLVCAAGLYAVLHLWSAEDVRTDPAYMFFYMVLGAAWVGLFRVQLPAFGLNVRDDVLERGNAASAWAYIGALGGATFCFAGANVGNGPGWWVVLFSALLSAWSLQLLWWVVHRASGLAEKVAVERDAGAGLRAAGFLIGAGMILGRAAAGDWVSAGATTLDFLRMGWPALVLAAVAVGMERCCPPDPAAEPALGGPVVAGWVPAIGYVCAGTAGMLAWPL